MDTHILLKTLPLSVPVWRANSFTQQTVAGRVIDSEASKALPGMSILVKGTTTNTFSDTNMFE